MLSFGMPYDVYWHDDFDMVEVYVKAYNKKIENDNRQAWLQGLYNYKAFDTVLSNAFRKKSDKGVPYLTEPIDLKPKKDELSPAEKLYNKFRPFMNLVNNKRNRKGR